MKIEQDAGIAAQIAKAVQGHDGPLSITVNQYANGNAEANAIPVMNDEALLAYIGTFPEPRLRNFIEHVYYLAYKKFNYQKTSAGL